jgi:signal recognition particle receptor subunit beta
VVQPFELYGELNKNALDRLRNNLLFIGRDPREIPLVFQVNKLDLPDRLPFREIKRLLMWESCQYLPSIATEGKGLKQAMDALITMIRAQRGAGDR